MNLQPEHESILKRVTAARNSERDAKRDALERAKAIAATEVEGYELATDLEVRRAHEAGIPNARIGIALGTSDARTVTNRLARTSQLVDVRQAHQEDADADPRFTIDEEGVLTVSLSGDELAKACESEDWTVAEATAAGVTSATFVVGQWTAVPQESRFIASAGKKHPVTAWAARSQHDDEIVAYFHARRSAA